MSLRSRLEEPGSRHTRRLIWVACLLFLLAFELAAQAELDWLTIVPWPKTVAINQGHVELKTGARIIAEQAELAPLAGVLSGEIYLSTAVSLLAMKQGPGSSSDILLRLSKDMNADEGYRLTVGPQGIVVEGRTYRGVAWGTVTLLQCIEKDGGTWRVPALTITDQPVAQYRGLLIDTARQWHPVESLRPLIEMCRLYKINYLQLHLNDQQSTVFPFKAFPQLASITKGQRRTYTLEEITDLVKYADERGVTIVPELEGPGHHAGNLRSIWGRGNTLDVFNEKTYQGLDVLVGELCEVFRSSPYIHIGADEGSFGHLGKSPEEQAYKTAHEVKGSPLDHYIRRADEIIKKHGKQTICWEGFHGDGGGLPKDIIVMPFESTYNPAHKLVAKGFSVINTAWKPLYVVNNKKWPADYIYTNWNLYLWEHHINARTHIQLQPTDPVLGAQMCAWEQSAEVDLPSIRERIHAMSERIWNPAAGRSLADFLDRAGKTDKLLDRVLGIVDVRVQGVQGQDRGFEIFGAPITLSLSAPAIGSIHYTIDGREPTVASPRYTGPITLTGDQTRLEKLFYNSRTKRFEEQGNVVRLKARLFDSAGQPIGDEMTVRQFWHKLMPAAGKSGPE